MKKTAKALVDEAMVQVTTYSVEQARALHGHPGVQFVDLRDVRELEREGVIPGAVHAPRGMLEFWVDPESPYHRDVFAQDKEYRSLLCRRLALGAGDQDADGHGHGARGARRGRLQRVEASRRADGGEDEEGRLKRSGRGTRTACAGFGFKRARTRIPDRLRCTSTDGVRSGAAPHDEETSCRHSPPSSAPAPKSSWPTRRRCARWSTTSTRSWRRSR